METAPPPAPPHENRKNIGQLLLERDLLLPEQLEAALARQGETGKKLGQLLIDMELITYDQLVEALSEQSGLPHIWLRKGLVDPKVAGLLPREKAQACCVIPMFKIRKTLTVAMAEAENVFVIDDIEKLTGLKVQPVQCRRDDIMEAIGQYYSDAVKMDDFLESFQEQDLQVLDRQYDNLEMVEDMIEGAHIINLVNLVLLNAIKEGASDIHLEPDLSTMRVRYRIDGQLQEIMTPRTEMHLPIISRIKVMARMDISERRVPQDGRLLVAAEGKRVDVRVSSMPTVLGEKIVMRILDKQKLVLDINRIGMGEGTLDKMKTLLRRPHGILLVTGPTGSGKTTTLYACLAHISTVSQNIVTIEDPVEFQLEYINQIQVNEAHGLSFARTLKSILRQDPDVIMLGEIRDRETAEVAIQASMTGHLVLSTLHTNESAGTVTRLMEMGIEPYLLASAMAAVVAQRLVRLVCDNCKTNYLPPAKLLKRIGWKGANVRFVVGHGCERCFDSGLRGRAGIFELLRIDDPLRQLILNEPTTDAVRALAIERGMVTLKDQAFELVETARTSLDEVLRVIMVEDSAAEEDLPPAA